VLRLQPGPQATPEALRALCGGEWGGGTWAGAAFRVVGQDRMGLRLSGPPLPGGQVISEATPLGAVQVTPAGEAIVLLNDRGRLGGYSKPAVVHPADLPRAAQLRPGQRFRFRLALGGLDRVDLDRVDRNGSEPETLDPAAVSAWVRRWQLPAD
jgi:Carboxyltransferase domain, subdomain A and B